MIRQIHGPVGFATFKYDNADWLLFGDQHIPVQTTLIPGDSVNIEYRNNNIIYVDSEYPIIWDISRLLFQMFAKIKQQGLFADFYLEMPFQIKPQVKIECEVKNNYIYKLFMIFNDCFYAHTLPQTSICALSPNVRMHYIDYRQIHNPKHATDNISLGLLVKDILRVYIEIPDNSVAKEPLRQIVALMDQYDVIALLREG